MNSLKPLILLVILGGVGFGVYRSLNKGPVEPPTGTDTSVTGPPEIKLANPDALAANQSGKNASPSLLRPEPGGTAPPFEAGKAIPNSAAESPGLLSAEVKRNTSADMAPPFNPGFGSERTENRSAAVGSQEIAAGAGSFASAWPTIQTKLAGGQLGEALKDLTAWRNHPSLTPSEQDWIAKRLAELAGTVIYSREHLLTAPYRVQPGDRLEDIAERHKVTAELLAKINGIEPTAPALRPGEEIKVVPGPFSAVVELGGNRLTLLLDGRYAGSFPLTGVGSALDTKMRASESLDLSVSQKTTVPIYNSPAGEIEAGDPANPLGQHLLALGGELAIHGTNPRASRQMPQPSGGIRMSADDVAELYDILTVGSRVVVRR